MSGALEYDVAVNLILRERPPGAIFAGRAVRIGQSSDAKQIRVVAGVTPTVGEVWRVSGAWSNDAAHGWVLNAERAYRAVPSGALVVPFLRKRVPEIGEARARRLRALGEDLLPILDAGKADWLAAVIEPRFPGVSARLAAALIGQWALLREEVAALDWLERNGVTDMRAAARALAVLGDRARARLEINPYLLASFMNWRSVEEIALPLLRRQRSTNPLDAPERLLGAVTSVVRQSIQAGSTAVSDTDLRRQLARLVGPERVDRAIRIGDNNRGIIRFAHGWRAPGCAHMEDAVARRFAGLAAGNEHSAVAIPNEPALRQRLDIAIQQLRIPLSREQRQAVIAAMQRPLCAIVGYAGCGKTTTLEAICALWIALGGRVEIAALSGIAALRATRATCAITGRPARTIFRLLREIAKNDRVNLDAGDDRARLDERTLLIIDEASMVGLGDWYRITSAMPPGCRLLMTGDPMQLPPIEFGVVFHRLEEHKAVTSRLTHVFRQEAATGIPLIAQAIRTGQEPVWAPYAGGQPSGASFVDVDDGSIAETVARIAQDVGGFCGSERLLIVAPTKKGSHAVDGLNVLFHRHHLASATPSGGTDWNALEVRGYYGHRFSPGEPVLHVENDYERGLFNGSLGRVISINPEARSLVARFDGHEGDVDFTSDTLIRLAAAYAVTCHKAQGSQIDRVIIPVYDTPLLDRTWLYPTFSK